MDLVVFANDVELVREVVRLRRRLPEVSVMIWRETGRVPENGEPTVRSKVRARTDLEGEVRYWSDERFTVSREWMRDLAAAALAARGTGADTRRDPTPHSVAERGSL